MSVQMVVMYLGKINRSIFTLSLRDTQAEPGVPAYGLG